MKPNIKKLIFLSTAILLAAVSCTAEGEDGQDKTNDTSTKLIRRIERTHGHIIVGYDIEYDASGRLSKVTIGGDEVLNYSYHENMIVFSSPLFNVTEYLDADGRLMKTISVFDDGGYTHTEEYLFKYDEKTGDPVLPDFLYSNGNYVENQGFFKYDYGKDSDNMNLDVFSAFFVTNVSPEPFIPFYSFPHIHNRNLCIGITDIYGGTGHCAITYGYDGSGNVVQINVGDDQIIRLYY